jgi:hypothetical protein
VIPFFRAILLQTAEGDDVVDDFTNPRKEPAEADPISEGDVDDPDEVDTEENREEADEDDGKL